MNHIITFQLKRSTTIFPAPCFYATFLIICNSPFSCTTNFSNHMKEAYLIVELLIKDYPGCYNVLPPCLSQLGLLQQKCLRPGGLNDKKYFSWFWSLGSPQSRCWLERFLVRALSLVCRWMLLCGIFIW